MVGVNGDGDCRGITVCDEERGLDLEPVRPSKSPSTSSSHSVNGWANKKVWWYKIRVNLKIAQILKC